MKLNYSILAAALSETEGKTIGYDVARHIGQNPRKGNNAARLLAALPAYKEAVLNGCATAQNEFEALEESIEKAARELAEKKLRKAGDKQAARRKKPLNTAIIGGAIEVAFDRVTRRKLRGATVGKYQYLGAGEVLQVSGWQSRKFAVGDKALFWKLKNK